MIISYETHLPQVGALDLQHRNSPIADDDDLYGHSDAAIEPGVCYFNGQPHAPGACVMSGGDMLRCTSRGVWERAHEP